VAGAGARVIVDRHVHILPAGALDPIARIARNAMADLHHPPEFLDVQCSNSPGCARS
jgi:hypothetical protein